jgi:anti-sigma factor RsiW
MKCQDVSDVLIAYLDGRIDSGDRREVAEHLAGCAACRTRADEFRHVSAMLGEMPAIEPSFGFDARARQRIAAEREARRGFFGLIPQPRVALSVAMLAALTVFIIKLPLSNPGAPPSIATIQQQDFNAIKNLGVLENYDVVTKLGALSELVPVQPSGSQPQDQKSSDDGGGA